MWSIPKQTNTICKKKQKVHDISEDFTAVTFKLDTLTISIRCQAFCNLRTLLLIGSNDDGDGGKNVTFKMNSRSV